MNKLMVKNNSKNERMSKIPSNWNAFRLKDIGYLYSGLSGKSAEDFTDASQFSAPFIPFTNVANNFYLSIGNMRSVIIYPTESQNYVKKNDFFFLMSSEGYEDIGKSSLLIRELSQRTYLNSFCKGFRLNKKNIDARYLNYFLHSVFCRNQIIVEGKGFTRINLKMEKINDLKLWAPPLNTQYQISKLLDNKTSLINDEIELLFQKANHYEKLKKSLINETVIHGLNKTVSMKDSGIEWIGKVPNHWNVSAITNLTSVVSIKNHPDEELLSVYRDYGVIIKSSRDDNHNKEGANLAGYKLVMPGYLVINKMKAWQGSLGVSEHRGIVSPAYITCKTNNKLVERRYLHHLLRCQRYIDQYNHLSFGVRNDQWDMRYEDFKYVPVLLPPKEEQKAIADYLDEKTAKIDQIVITINQQIENLKELRKTLINDVVTGKIKLTQDDNNEGLAA